MRKLSFFLIVALSACQGVISEPGEQPGAGGGSGAGTGTGGATNTTKDALVPLPRVARLTHLQWENTLVDLFELAAPTGKSAAFPGDPTTGGYLFDNDTEHLSVDQALWGSYQRAAEEVAEMVVSNATLLGKIMPASADATEFIETFGKRVYRRPLTATEVSDHLSIYQGAAALFPDKTPVEAGVQLVLTAFLQSPHFVYRVESSTEKDGGTIPLSGWETASRLSYTLWNTMPDSALFDAAEAGELATEAGVEAQARAMLQHPRAEAVLNRFHAKMLDVSKFANIQPLSSLFPDAPANMGDLAVEENERFIQFIFRGGGGYRELLTSNVTFVNDDTAKLYDLTGNYGSTLTEATLDPSRRRGVFTQLGFLASNASSADPDPIHRGAFMARRIACLSVSAPPGQVPPLPANDGSMTNREVVAAHTEEPGSDCAGCHVAKINPFGFSFENYDAIGRWRDTDNGFAVDASSSVLINGEDQPATPVSGAVELIDAMADSAVVHECYAKYWAEYAFGRSNMPQDQGVISYIGQNSLNGASLEDLIVKLVTTRAFRNRSTEEMP